MQNTAVMYLEHTAVDFPEKIAVKEFPDRNIQTVTNNLYRHYTWIFAFGVKQTVNC